MGYSIQVGSFVVVRNAELLTSRLQQRGIDAFYFKKEDGQYAVRFGNYPDRERAKAVAERLKTKGIIDDYFIVPPSLGKIPSQRYEGRDKDLGFIIARTAERFIGIPYKWGGNNVIEGLDCSGFVKAVYSLCGINLPRTAREQFMIGKVIEKDELAEGDLVFFGTNSHITHVGIYVGKGDFVHAPKRGDVIRRSSLNSDYFAKHFMGGRRYY